ncbi:MAG: tetratricopeptide repeat protein [Candidatus Poribacteria bacterium]|nr:tetratricopeptide repeat protein [Candidatus Poribacteria bacterium]
MNDKSDPQNELNRVFKKIQEIVEKSSGGEYIYRGEPEHYQEPPYYGKVSSTLYRHLKTVWVMGLNLDIEEFQKQVLNDAREHIHEPVNDFEILTELQHYGGKTNLIDFSTDYHIAIFFACDGSPGKNGRLILQKRNEIGGLVEKPREPNKPINRVIGQKSIFIRPHKGFIEPDPKDVVYIQGNLKIPMLEYLRKYHNISTKTIYNDLHGFIRTQNIHHRANEEFYSALICGKQHEDAKAINHYTNALEMNPQMDSAYYNRGLAYAGMGEYDKAIEDYDIVINRNSEDAHAYNNRGDALLYQGKFNKAIKDYNTAIKLKPDYGFFYLNRSKAWLYLQEWKKAKSDLTSARENGFNSIGLFHNDYESVADFEEKNNIQLPKDITAMLT